MKFEKRKTSKNKKESFKTLEKKMQETRPIALRSPESCGFHELLVLNVYTKTKIAEKKIRVYEFYNKISES